ncbi:MAG: glycosyltransferase family A protein [Bryobacteraceae bacterium]|jgi:glycosyltransferase involved in cell wall biosynthesis
MPTVAAVIPVYNRFQYLEECLASVLGQSRPPDEIIVVDDCSHTPVAEFLARSRYGDQVKALRTDRNRGSPGARNLGWRSAESELIAFNDSDDVWRRDKLERQLAHLQSRPETSGVSSALEAFFPDGRTEIWAADRPASFALSDSLIFSQLSVQSLLIRRDALAAVGGFDERFRNLQDWDLSIRLAQAGFRIDCMAGDRLVRLRRNDENLSGRPWRVLRYETQLIRRHAALLQQVFGRGATRVQFGRALIRAGYRIRFSGRATRAAARLLEWSAPGSALRIDGVRRDRLAGDAGKR